MNIKRLIIGGGCFWCTEAIFTEVDGVEKVVSGYSGGQVENPSYREVCGGRTGHAEVVEITYNSDVVSIENLLLIHLVTHDPTTLNRQGADRGTQYRSIIFYADEAEKRIAEKVMLEVQTAYDDPIVTALKPVETFYKAEAEHQDYYKNNANAGYCQAVIAPKLTKFRKIYQKLKK
ncbi:peptide-methionine (S)-S-oxide reductase MsrA [Portibacter lacus]|uniref:Peptide methionine sulfoxide reductase MsrA n=1 Tax=Portibacter lacus TaxID=1099794 RepID=A0AA37SQ79_9BACT|nr:peptide-methionine (S)-S-oxide reductase MsrA [Portibacter lacus]GLR18991.1 peptide methionine sulfoxide reductase MsrA 1 [Portibacter lacus]